jgi:hypothetical protein
LAARDRHQSKAFFAAATLIYGDNTRAGQFSVKDSGRHSLTISYIAQEVGMAIQQISPRDF